MTTIGPVEFMEHSLRFLFGHTKDVSVHVGILGFSRKFTTVPLSHGQLQWEDTDETEKAYKIRYLTADGTQTDEANAVHIAAFVGCTYHCG